MSAWSFAPTTTRVATGSAFGETVEVANGDPLRVWGFVLFGSTVGGTTRVESADGTIVYAELTWPAAANRVPFVWSEPFIADRGLRLVTPTAALSVLVVYHGNTGT